MNNRRLWQPGERYYGIVYHVKGIIAAADLRFERRRWSGCKAHSRPKADKWKGSTAESCLRTT